jgi:hypothetical protein
VVEVLALVLRIFRSEIGDCRGVLVALMWLRFEQLTSAVQSQPREPRPILGPAIDEERDLRQHEQVVDAGQVVGVLAPLPLLVERAVEPGPGQSVVGYDEVANRDEPWPSLRSDRCQRG